MPPIEAAFYARVRANNKPMRKRSRARLWRCANESFPMKSWFHRIESSSTTATAVQPLYARPWNGYAILQLLAQSNGSTSIHRIA